MFTKNSINYLKEQYIRTINLILTYLLTSGFVFTQHETIYSKSFGERRNPYIIYIHGGLGGNSNLFEATTAKNLTNSGFYVIVYDRRVEGRSEDLNVNMKFEENILKNAERKFKSTPQKVTQISAIKDLTKPLCTESAEVCFTRDFQSLFLFHSRMKFELSLSSFLR